MVGRTPSGKGEIVYVGSSNGKLYAIDAATGKRRWSFDTTPAGGAARPQRPQRLAGAGQRGIYIGGEHGYLAYVPYDYCRKRATALRPQPGPEFGNSVNRVFFVTPGGTTKRGASERSPPRPCSAPG